MNGQRVKDFVRVLGISQAELARRLGYTQQNLSTALSKEDIRTGLLERIAEALGVPVSAFYGETTQQVAAAHHGVAVAGDTNQVATCDDRLLALLEEKDRQIAALLRILDRSPCDGRCV